MIADMPRPRPPHLHRQVTRHGKVVWYVRVGHGDRIRIRSEFGSPEFQTEYAAAVAGSPITVSGHGTPRGGSLAWLIERYRQSSDWNALSPATHRRRDGIFRRVKETAGDQSFTNITKATIVAGRERRASAPGEARQFLDAMRGLFRWAVDAEHAKVDPTIGVKNPKRKKGRGFPPWTEAEVDQYYARWPLGTKERVWIDVIQYTGLRKGDAVQLGKQHVRKGVAALRTEKSGEMVTVTLPILPILQATLDAGPCGDLAFICGEKGGALNKDSFGNLFRAAVRAAGIRGKSAHGLRKIGAIRAAENGATVNELEAIFGWEGGNMAALYTREANRKRLSTTAMIKLERGADANEAGTSIPPPSKKVRESEAKN